MDEVESANAPRRGRRPGSPETSAAILAAAREAFSAKGFTGTSMRAIATAAGVDPALVHHYFKTKDQLFLASLAVPVDPQSIIGPAIAGGVDGAGERILRMFLSVWENPDTRLPVLTLLRRVAEPGGDQLIRDVLSRFVLGPVGEGLGVDDPTRRMAWIASQLIGLAMVRYVVMLPPVASAPVEELVATYAPTLQRYLTEPLLNHD